MTGAAARGVLGGAAVIALGTLLARLAGFVRWLVFSQALGATATGSAYIAANSLPNVLFEVVAGGALAVMVVPLLAGPLGRGDLDRASATCSALATWTVTLLLPLGALLALLSGPLTRAVGAGTLDQAAPGTAGLAARLGLMFAVQVPLYGIGLVASGALQAARRFAWPALAPLLSSVIVICVYAVFGATAGGRAGQPADLDPGAVALLGWGTTAGVAMLTLPLLIPASRLGLRLRWTYRFPPGQAPQAWRLAGAGLAGLAAQQVSVLVVVALANAKGGPGGLPAYHYAQAVYLLPYAVLAFPLVTAAFPALAVARQDPAELGAKTRATTRAVIGAALLGAAALVAAAGGIESVFSAIDRSGSAAGLAGAVTAFAPGLIGLALLTQCQRVLYAASRTSAAVAATSTAYLVQIAASAALTWWTVGDQPSVPRALIALGAGSSLGMTLGAAVGLAAVRRLLGPGALGGVGRTAGAALAGAVAGGLVGRHLAGLVDAGGGWPGLAAAAVGALVAGAAVAVAALVFDRSVFQLFRRRPPADR